MPEPSIDPDPGLEELKELDPTTYDTFKEYTKMFTRSDEQWYDILIGRIRWAIETHITLYHGIDLMEASKLGIHQWAYTTKYGLKGFEIAIWIGGYELIKESGSPASAWLNCYLKALKACKLCQNLMSE